jgi:hypothetical protein
MGSVLHRNVLGIDAATRCLLLLHPLRDNLLTRAATMGEQYEQTGNRWTSPQQGRRD